MLLLAVLSLYVLYVSDCPVGRWGVNCVGECHCSAAEEQCDQVTGECDSGCAQGWYGPNCQGKL